MFEEGGGQLFPTSQEQTWDRNKHAVTIACILLPAATTLGNLFVDGWCWYGGGGWGEVEDQDIGFGAAAGSWRNRHIFLGTIKSTSVSLMLNVVNPNFYVISKPKFTIFVLFTR